MSWKLTERTTWASSGIRDDCWVTKGDKRSTSDTNFPGVPGNFGSLSSTFTFLTSMGVDGVFPMGMGNVGLMAATRGMHGDMLEKRVSGGSQREEV
jgi:hypothetical protein